MKRKGKKLLIALLSLCMVMTMAPLGSWAADGEKGEPAVNVARIASDGGTKRWMKRLKQRRMERPLNCWQTVRRRD